VSTAAAPAVGRASVRTKVALGFEVLATYVEVRLHLRRKSLPEALKALRGVERLEETAGLQEAPRLARAVRRTLAVLPVDGRCLAQSLVLTRLLSRRGIASDLVIGVVPGEDFAAHAWVEVEHVPLLPAYDGEFATLGRL